MSFDPMTIINMHLWYMYMFFLVKIALKNVNEHKSPTSVFYVTKKISLLRDKDVCINKPPLPTDAFDDVNTPISCTNTTDIDDIEGSSSYIFM